MDNEEHDLDLSFQYLIEEQESHLAAGNYGATTNMASNMQNALNDSNHRHLDKTQSVEEIHLNMMTAADPPRESTTLVRKRMKSVKESSEGIEHILDDMPSRTVGRKRGAKFAGASLSKFGSVYRHQRMASVVDEVDASELYNEISGESGDIDNNELRELAVNMTLKRKVWTQVRQNREIKQTSDMASIAMWKYRMALKWSHTKDDFSKFVSSANLWNHHLKQVEGNFGSGVLSYFTFLRAIFLLSIPSFMISFMFISIPQLLDQPSKPECKFTGEELLTGANCLTNTIMYQGYYTNTTINKIGNTYYSMPMAYLFATFGYFILCLIWLAKTTAVLFRNSYIDAKEDSTNYFSKVFCSWNFGTTSQSTADLKHKTITTDLKEILAEQRREVDHRTGCEKFEIFLLRMLTWGVYLGLLAGSIALVYFTNKSFICEIKSQTGENPIFQDLAMPLIVSAINLLLPYLITLITHLEKYKYPRHELYISVLRNFLFKMSLLGVICAFWTVTDLKESCGNSTTSEDLCWETKLGQQIYRLVIVDFIFSMIFSTFCAEFLTNMLFKVIGKKRPEFSISNNVMDLIYGQTLCWIGVYFSPLLALINIIKYFLLFYVKKISVMNNCKPSTKHWRAAQSQTLFNCVQLFSFLLSAAYLLYVIFNMKPSDACGPFRSQSKAYDIVIEKFSELAATTSGEWFAVLLDIITNVWVLYGIVIALLVIVVFTRNKAKGLHILGDALKEQIALEGKDKTLLLKWLQGMAKQRDRRFQSSNVPGPSTGNQAAGEVLLADPVFFNSDLDLIENEELPP